MTVIRSGSGTTGVRRAPLVFTFVLVLVLLEGSLIGRASVASAASADIAGPTVAPGSVVRWTADVTAACGMGTERWEPVGSTCWYPIDLLHPPGSVELVRWRAGRRESATVRVGEYPYEVQHIELRDDSTVHLSDHDLVRVRRESRAIGALWSRREPRLFELPLVPPLDPLPESGRFGARRFFNGEPRSPHTGADYKAPSGAPVRAAADAVVALADNHFFAGNSVFLDHGDGLITMYFHLSEIDVEEGERVERGQAIGRVGASGRATGPHLHFGVRWRGERVDPEMLLRPSAAPSVH